MDDYDQPKNDNRQFFFLKKELVRVVSFLLILLSSFILLDIVAPFDPRFLSLYGFLPTSRNHRESSSSEGSLLGCDFYTGRWVRDESHRTQSYDETCPFLDPGFRCVMCGRKDVEYLNWRWQPDTCDIPRFNATELLERGRHGRIVFAGDSIARNQWESLLCMLAQGVSNKSSIYEENGEPITKHMGFLSMRFSEHNLTVEYYRVPFLVPIGHATRKQPPPEVRVTLKLDQLHWYSAKWVEADVLVFSAGHWWNEFKTSKSGIYFEEGGNINMSMNVMEAFEKSLKTWKSWTMDRLNPEKTHVFYRSYSPAHYRKGTWDSKGRCDLDTQPEKDYRLLGPEPVNNRYVYDIMKQIEHENRTVHFLNITHMTQFRYDGHPGTHREPGTRVHAPQDCSHWCLPGVPDAWNEMLYAHLMSIGFRAKR